MSAFTNLFASAQNIVTAINGAANTYLSVNGTTNSAGITTATLVKSSSGRVCTITVIVAGSAPGMVYDASSAAATNNPLYVIPTTTGAYVLNMPALSGIVVAPGSGQTVSVSYS